MSYFFQQSLSTPSHALQSRYGELVSGGAFHANAPTQMLSDNHAQFQAHVPAMSNNQKIQMVNGLGGAGLAAAPYVASTYQTPAHHDDRVYVGTYIEPGTGQEHHAWENAMPEKEVDESLNHSFDAMERLSESFMGGINDDVRRKLGIPNYKPEKNIMEPAVSGQDGFRTHVGEWDAIRMYNLEKARAAQLYRMENNVEGIDERVGGPTGYIGLHPMQYARKQDVQAPVTAFELDDRERLVNPTVQVEQHGAWAKPTMRARPESMVEWQSTGTWGNVFGMREINEFPGDRKAKTQAPSFFPNKSF